MNKYAQADIVASAAMRDRGVKLLDADYDAFFKTASGLDIADMGEGNVESPVGWFAVIDMRGESEAIGDAPSQSGFQSVMAAVTDLVEYEGHVPSPGVYFTTTNSDGIIWVYECANIAVAHQLFDEAEQAFDKWDNVTEGGTLAEDEEG